MCLSSPRGARDETPVGQASAKAAPAKMDHVRQQAPPDMDVSKRETQEPTTVSLQREPPPLPVLNAYGTPTVAASSPGPHALVSSLPEEAGRGSWLPIFRPGAATEGDSGAFVRLGNRR